MQAAHRRQDVTRAPRAVSASVGEDVVVGYSLPVDDFAECLRPVEL